jgi:FKBP-type peptidyl-prolyl cis-trans isomerase 2
MEKGDIIRWEFEAWIVEDGNEVLFDTTNEDLAKEQGIHDPNVRYGPMVSIVGAGRLIKGIEEELLKAEIGKEYEVTIPPEKAYGERDPKLVKIHSYRELARQKIEPEVGKEVIINNKRGRIVTVTPGRVVIDFNHPLAGKTLKYKFKIVEKVKDEAEKVRAIIEMDYGKDVDKFNIELKDEDIIIELPDVCKYDSNWAVAKYAIVGDIRDYVANKNVKFVEVYSKKEENKEEEPTEEIEEETKEGSEEESSEEESKESEESAEETEGH